ncbi:glycosyltransferase family 25 protein [Enterobacter hormaechei]|uniref:glycosyltransferase family 25 protein n=1 Tax=Enterobacter hormaechei TaxID=158836 RepID=UPI003D6B1E5F
MKIFIVNLKKSVERRQKMEAQLQALGLEAEFIEAVDGRLMSEEERKSVTAKVNYAFLPGEIGCALSHQKIYKKMIDENIDNALILEDDVVLDEEFKKVLAQISIPADRPSVILLSRSNKFFKKPLKKLTNKHSLHKTLHATTTHSYIVNKIAARSLLKGLNPVWIVADKWALFEDMSLVDVYSVVPHPVHLSDEAKSSTINIPEDAQAIHKKKKELWNLLMSRRTLKTKLKHKYRRAILPIFSKVVNQGKG